MKLINLLEIEYGVHDMLCGHMDQIKLDSGPNTYRMLQTQLALGKDAEVENWLIKHGYEEEKSMPFEEQMLNEEPKDGVDGVKPGSIKPDVIRGRKVKRYIKVSKKGRETPMISYDEPDPKDKPKDKPKDSNVKKYPFIGGESGNQYEVQKFDMDSEAEKLYKSLQNTMIDRKGNEDFLKALKLTAIANDEIFFLRIKAETDKKASKAMVKCCEDLLKYIHSESDMKDAVRMHKYLDKHINLVKETYKKNPREDQKDDCFTISDLEKKAKDRRSRKFRSQTFGARNPAPTYESKISLTNLINEEHPHDLPPDDKALETIREYVKENLRNWFKKEKWKRIDTQGNIKGDCGTMPKGKKTQRCLPAAKANSLTKKQRAATSRKKARSNKQFVSNTKKAKVKLNK